MSQTVGQPSVKIVHIQICPRFTRDISKIYKINTKYQAAAVPAQAHVSAGPISCTPNHIDKNIDLKKTTVSMVSFLIENRDSGKYCTLENYNRCNII